MENKTAILVVSFGTSYNDSRETTIGAVEAAVGAAFPEYELRRAFTSQVIINKLKKRDGIAIDNMEEALDRAAADGVENLLVQPTHMIGGIEYTALAEKFKNRRHMFKRAVLGAPLLADDGDFHGVIQAITEDTASYDDGSTAICFMGHGTEAAANAVYTKLQDMISAAGYENYYIGTVEANPTIENLVSVVNRAGKYRRVVLKPLMVVAGDHANNDMAGEGADSWKSIFEAAGYQVICLIEGLGQMPAIQAIYAAHAKAAMNGTGADGRIAL